MRHSFAILSISLLSVAVAAPVHAVSTDSTRLITGTVIAIDQSILTLRTRTGGSVKIDDAQAILNERVGTKINVGTNLTVQGSLTESNGALQATSITRAKGIELWPLDR